MSRAWDDEETTPLSRNGLFMTVTVTTQPKLHHHMERCKFYFMWNSNKPKIFLLLVRALAPNRSAAWFSWERKALGKHWERTWRHEKTWKSPPVICTESSIHCRVHTIRNKPMKAIIISQMIGLPISVSHVTTSGVQVSQNNNICNAQLLDDVIIYSDKLLDFLISFRWGCMDGNQDKLGNP